MKIECRKHGDTLAIHGVRINPRSGLRKRLGLKRTDIVKISVGNKSIWRVVVFGKTGVNDPLFVDYNNLRMSYDSLIDLGVTEQAHYKKEVDVQVTKPAPLIASTMFHWNHPDGNHKHGVRSAIYLLVVGFMLSEALADIHAMFLDAWLRQWWLS